ncbi:alpha/beta hydrolase [Pseudomonas sp. dw_358]|uniref:alpha/beta hydrolase n=1 Tax=Pseudomonas sp. dw_358 TaxID=2720083 RepID=UPI0023DE880A|nr:alpha/beta hydrolase [Pseudomonas sp. dw_358]
MSDYPLSAAMAGFVEKTRAYACADEAIDAQRFAYRRMCAAFTPPRSASLEVLDRIIAQVPVRRYRPKGLAPTSGWGWLLYLHGGGWVVGDLDSHDFICAELAVALQVTVVAVDYRLAPEHPFPAALQDCLAVWQGLIDQPAGWQLAARPGTVMGDSAGGNLAAALCLALRDTGRPVPAAQVLIYPGLGGSENGASRRECRYAPLLGAQEVQVYQQLYVPATARTNPLALPLLAGDFSRLPPAFVAVAQFDPLRDDGVEYHRRLLAAGVVSELYWGEGLVHGCLRGRHQVPEVDALYAALLDFWS